MRAAWAILGGLAVGGGIAWWLGHASAPHPSPEARSRAEAAAAAEDALRPLYRWRDDAGNLQVTDTPPPKGRRYERVALQPEPGIRVESTP